MLHTAAVTVLRDWQFPGHTYKSPREIRFWKGLMVREAPVAAQVIAPCSRERRTSVLFVLVLLFLLFRDCHYHCFWSRGGDGVGGLHWVTQIHLSGNRTKKMALRKCPKLQTAATSQ